METFHMYKVNENKGRWGFWRYLRPGAIYNFAIFIYNGDVHSGRKRLLFSPFPAVWKRFFGYSRITGFSIYLHSF